MSAVWHTPAHEALRADAGFSVADFDYRATAGFDGDKDDGKALLKERGRRLSDLQEMLFAHGRAGGTRSVLLVLQGMDTAGKGGIVRHVLGMVDPQGVALTSFGVPTPEERAHHFLWRVDKALPAPGRIGVFDRSHYEDVLVVRVHNLVPAEQWEGRYDEINDFERRVVDAGTRIVKVALMVSPDEQLERLAERLDRPDKHWKYNPGDLDERQRWDEYMAAYEAAISRCSEAAPWHAVPADRKWFARLAITELLIEALESLDLDWPLADFDVADEKRQLEALRVASR